LIEHIKILNLNLKVRDGILTLEEVSCGLKSCSDLWVLLKFNHS